MSFYICFILSPVALPQNDFIPPTFLTCIHSSPLSHPFCPNLPVVPPVSISIHICVELVWGLDHSTPSFLPHPLPHYSSMCEIKLPHAEGGDSQTGSERGKEGWEDGAAEGSHNQVLVTVFLSGSCQLQLASWYIIQLSLCSAIFALPPCSSLVSSSSPPLFMVFIHICFFYACFFWSPNSFSIWSFILSLCTLIILWSCTLRALKGRRQHPLSEHPSEKHFM